VWGGGVSLATGDEVRGVGFPDDFFLFLISKWWVFVHPVVLFTV